MLLISEGVTCTGWAWAQDSKECNTVVDDDKNKEIGVRSAVSQKAPALLPKEWPLSAFYLCFSEGPQRFMWPEPHTA